MSVELTVSFSEAKVCLDALRLETDRQAGHHMTVANEIKTGLEPSLTAFLNRQIEHKRTRSSAIEKAFKTKQTREGYVNKAKEKYEADCLRINSYTAQATLSQGRDLEKIQQKLERARQTVQANERDFANFSRALQDTVAEWERDWKEYCDRCQDMEEDRLDFLRDHLWAYANAISTVCVNDDQVCFLPFLSNYRMLTYETAVMRANSSRTRTDGYRARYGELRS